MRFGYIAHAHVRGEPALVCGLVINDVPAADRGIHNIVPIEHVTCEACLTKLEEKDPTDG